MSDDQPTTPESPDATTVAKKLREMQDEAAAAMRAHKEWQARIDEEFRVRSAPDLSSARAAATDMQSAIRSARAAGPHLNPAHMTTADIYAARVAMLQAQQQFAERDAAARDRLALLGRIQQAEEQAREAQKRASLETVEHLKRITQLLQEVLAQPRVGMQITDSQIGELIVKALAGGDIITNSIDAPKQESDD